MGVTDLHKEYLDAMGIQVWTRREPATTEQVDETPQVQSAAIAEPASVPPQPRPPVQPGPQQDDTNEYSSESIDKQWQRLEHEVRQCMLCEQLCQQRTQTVFGVGNRQADWLVIGEAPGAEEDRQGEPFVGRAGKLLNEMLLAIGLKREQVFIANILKCRPPNNRDPRPEEIANCHDYLQRQIALVQPRIILAVGRIAAQSLLDSDTPVGKLRGKTHQYACPRAGDTPIPLVVTYHPAYLLRSPAEKRRAWQDLQLARSIVAAAS
jgi:uracil-DNA glycosylase family 4